MIKEVSTNILKATNKKANHHTSSSRRWNAHCFCILKATTPKVGDLWVISKVGWEGLQKLEVSRTFWWGNKISGTSYAVVSVLYWSGHAKPLPSSKTSSKKKTMIHHLRQQSYARRIHRKQRTCREQTCYCSLRWKNQGWLDPDWFWRKANFSCGRRQSSAQRNPYLDSPWISHEENIARRWLLVLSLKSLGSAVKVSSCLNRKVTDAGLAADCIWMAVPLSYILNWSYLFLIAIFPQSKVLSSTVWCLHYWLDCVINLRGWCVIL